MSERPRFRSRSGRSSPKMYDMYAEESFEDGYTAGYKRGCFDDGANRGYLDGYNARRLKKAQGNDDNGDTTDTDGESDGDNDDGNNSRKLEIMDKIWDLAEPGSELEKLVLEYDDENDKDNTDEEEESDNKDSDEEYSDEEYSDDENDQNDTDNTDVDQEDSTKDKKN